MQADWLIGVVATGILGLMWWDVRGFKKWVMAKVERLDQRHQNGLYNSDGSTIYMPRVECAVSRQNCPAAAGEQWRELRQALEKRENEWAATREQLLLAITNLQAKVDLLLDNGNHRNTK